MTRSWFILLALYYGAQGQKLAIVMIDGFRWDYVDRMEAADVPNFSSFLAGGSRAEYVQPIFPSMSWPSWTTIATGNRIAL